MKRSILISLMLFPLLLWAQEEVEEHITIIDDEECGCELYFVDSIQTTKKDNLFGFKHADGHVIVEPQYTFAGHWSGNYCIVGRDYYQRGLLNRQGREVAPCIYQDVSLPSDGMIRVQRDNLYGYLHEDGSEAIAPQFVSASIFREGYAVVAIQVDSLTLEFAYIDHSGQVVLSGGWQYAYPFINGYAVIKNYDRYGLIDREGREVVTAKHETLTGVDDNGIFFASDPFGERFAIFTIDGMRQLSPYRYDAIIGYGDGLYTFVRDEQYGFLDTEGHERFGLYDEAEAYSKGYVKVAREGRYGILDLDGNVVLPLAYDYSDLCNDCYYFHEGLAVVQKGGKFGFCDETGAIVIPIIYDRCFGFAQGLAPVSSGGKWGYIDHQGGIVIPQLFDAASPFQYGRAEVYYNGHTSKINTKGQCVKACQHFPVWKFINIEDLQK